MTTNSLAFRLFATAAAWNARVATPGAKPVASKKSAKPTVVDHSAC